MSGVVRVSAYALCRDEQQRLLMCRVAPTDPLDAGRWTLPGGGLDFGEQPQAGALRELFEETGLIGEIVAVIHVDSRHYPPNERREIDMHAVRIVFEARIVGGQLRDEPDGSTDRAAWLSLEQARAMPLVELGERALELAQRDAGSAARASAAVSGRSG